MSEQEEDQPVAAASQIEETQEKSQRAGDEQFSSMMEDETSNRKASPEAAHPAAGLDSNNQTPFTKVGPPGLQQDESNVLVQPMGADGEEIIEDEMVKSAELEDP